MTDTNSAAPGIEDSSGSDDTRSKKVHFPFLQCDDEGKPTILLTDPAQWADFNGDVHKPLKKSHFKHLFLFYEYQASVLEAKAAEYRKQAGDAKALGAIADQDTAKRVMQLKASLDKLTATLDEDSRALLEQLMSAKTAS